MRRRGAGNFFNQLGEGDPLAWTVLIGAILVIAGIGVFTILRARKAAAEEKERERKDRKRRKNRQQRDDDEDE